MAVPTSRRIFGGAAVFAGLAGAVLGGRLAAGAAAPALASDPPAQPAPAPAAAKPAPAPTPKPTPKPTPTPEDPEVKEGREAYEDMMRSGIKLVTDPAVLDRVKKIGGKIAAIADKKAVTPALYGSDKLVPYNYQFFVVDDPDINAFSLPGGYIFVNKGLLNAVQSDDELAGVLGHEITHAAHHHVKRLEKEQGKLNLAMAAGMLAAIFAHMPSQDMMNAMTGLQLIAIEKVNGYGQQAERDADNGAIVLMTEAGYNPVGMLTFMERLARQERNRPDIDYGIYRTHPPSNERAAAATAQLNKMGVTINRRQVTTELQVAVRKAAAPGKKDVVANEVTVDGKVFFRTTSDERCKATADALNKALDQSLQIYDVQKKGNVVLARGKPLLTAQPEDAVLLGDTATPEAVADQAYKALRMALYADLLQNGN